MTTKLTKADIVCVSGIITLAMHAVIRQKVSVAILTKYFILKSDQYRY